MQVTLFQVSQLTSFTVWCILSRVHMAGNNDMELKLAVCEINCVSPTFNTCIKTSIEAVTELLCCQY